MKRRYRFEIDLSQGKPLPTQPPEDSFTLSAPAPEGLEVSTHPVLEEPELEPPPPQRPSPETVRVYRQLRDRLESQGRTRVLERQGNERLEETSVRSCGSISRRVYERVYGPEQDLSSLSLSSMEDAHFAAWPGYEMRTHLYQAREGVLQYHRLELVCWVQGRLERKVL